VNGRENSREGGVGGGGTPKALSPFRSPPRPPTAAPARARARARARLYTFPRKVTREIFIYFFARAERAPGAAHEAAVARAALDGGDPRADGEPLCSPAKLPSTTWFETCRCIDVFDLPCVKHALWVIPARQAGVEAYVRANQTLPANLSELLSYCD